MLKSCVVTVLSSNSVLEWKNWVRCVIFLYSRTAMDTTFYFSTYCYLSLRFRVLYLCESWTLFFFFFRCMISPFSLHSLFPFNNFKRLTNITFELVKSQLLLSLQYLKSKQQGIFFFFSQRTRDLFYAPILHRSVQISLIIIIIIIVINNNNNDNSNNDTDNVNNIPFTLIKRVRYTQLNRKKKTVAGVLLKIPYL